MLILISDAFGPSLPGRLADLGEVTDDKSRVADADVVLIRSKTKVTREYIDGAPKLKYVIRGGVGLDNVDLEYAKEKGIRVDNTADASSVAVAELAMAMMLGAINHIPAAHQTMSEGKWAKKELKRTELYKKTLGLIGIGRIGSCVAERCKAFGMKVIAFDAYVKETDVAELKGSLDELLAEADVISLHTPLTDETRGMLNAEKLAKAKEGVIIVNTARGLVVDEADMTKALEDGHIGCYATDVWSSDPPPDDCPILKAPNTLMAPHIGASTAENMGRIGDIVVEKLTAFAKEQ